MKITVKQDLGATLPEDRKQRTDITCENDLILSRGDYCLHIDGPACLTFRNAHFIFISDKTVGRIARFIFFSKAVWGFCK